MSEWKLVKLGEICSILSGYAFDSKLFTDNPNASTPLIRIRDITKGYTTTYTCEDCNEKYIVKTGDILVGMDGQFNVAPWKSEDALLNQRVCKIWPSTNTLLDRYLLYFLPKVLKEIEKETSYVTVKHLSTKDMRDIAIPLPPLETQRKIAKTLDTVSELLAMRKQQLAELDNLIKSTFYYMFGDPVTNEKGWDIKKLSDIGDADRGVSKHRPRNAPSLLGGKHPLIQTGDVANADMIIKSYNQTYSDLGLKQSKMWRAGTLCITIAANIAKTAILCFEACFPDSIVGFTANDYTNNLYVHCWFGFFQKALEAQAPESAQKNINLKILRDLNVITPPINLQNQFASIVNVVIGQKALIVKSINKTQYLFDSLLSKYFD